MSFFHQHHLHIPVGNIELKGDMAVSSESRNIIVFAHGSGSSRLSTRNQMVARYLNERNFGTLLFDLLTEEEDWDYANRFHIEMLAGRLLKVTEWLMKREVDCQIGYFGASTGAASALLAAAALPEIKAVVSRGGRPDLAKKALAQVQAPTLLIVGSRDTQVLELNEDAYRQLHCEKQLQIVEGATHLFEEEGAMGKVCDLAVAWFEKYLQPVKVPEQH